MKKLICISAVLLLLLSLSVTCFAVDYSKNGISFEVPENCVEDADFAEKSELDAYWFTEDYLFEFSIWSEDNYENYTYVNYSEIELNRLYKVYVRDVEYTVEKESAENVVINGFEGIKIVINCEEEDYSYKHVLYGFSTKEKVYNIYFYAYDEAYLETIEEIVQSISIEGKAHDAEKENNIQIVIYVAILWSVLGISGFVRRRKAKKQGAAAESCSENTVVFNPETDFNNDLSSNETVTSDTAKSVTKREGSVYDELQKEKVDREKNFLD